MAYLNIQKAEFNRATENLIEIAWKYESLKVLSLIHISEPTRH